MNRTTGWVIAAVMTTCLDAAWATEAPSQTGETMSPLRATATQAFRMQHPDVRFYTYGGMPTRVYGRPFSHGTSAVDSAERFVVSHSGLFGVRADELDPSSLVFDGRHTQPVMFDQATGTYKFTLVSFTQRKAGLEVYRADLRLLVRNEPGFPLVLAASSLRDLSTFVIPAGVIADAQLGVATARQNHPSLTQFTAPRQIIWAGVDDMNVDPAVAYRFIGTAIVGEPEEWLFITDAQTGAMLHKEDQIYHADLVGNVSGMATQGVASGECNEEEPEGLAYALVSEVGIVGTSYYADENGDFVIPNVTEPVLVTSMIEGRWFVVNNNAGAASSLELTVGPPGTASFLHNEANASELTRAEVNGYVEANAVRDLAIAANPDYPNLNTLEGERFEVNVNLNQTCNAFYSPGAQTINFYRSGGGCPNSSFSTVVHHEYGHHLVAMAGSGQNQYGEGTGDVMSVLVTDQPLLGLGWSLGNCSAALRHADNTQQYPCTSSGAGHNCAGLMSGCVWDTRNALLATNPSDYRTILNGLAVNAILLHNGSQITPQITIDYVTLDDDDDVLGNGTPHYVEIDAGFSAHAMPAPPLTLLAYTYPQGQPLYSEPKSGAAIEVEIQSDDATFNPNIAPRLHTSINGDPFTSTPLSHSGGDSYSGNLPAAPCLGAIRWYVSAVTTTNITTTSPYDAPDVTFSASVVTEVTTPIAHDFENDGGFTVSTTAIDGPWDRGVPVDCDRGNPPADYDGSGQCWLTDNSAANDCNSDVDNGSTTLTTPTIDLSETDVEFTVSYARWYSNTFGAAPNADTFVVAVSNDNGATWTTLETVGPAGPEADGGWYFVRYNINDFIAPTDQMLVRFVASDVPPGSVIEAAIDAFSIDRLACVTVDTIAPVVVHDDGQTTHPFAGYIDPRSESNNGVALNRGIDSATIRFSEPVRNVGGGALSTAAFTVSGTGGTHPGVESIDASGNPLVVVNLTGLIPVKQWTTIIMNVEDMAGNPIENAGDLGPGVDEVDRVDIGFLPADVNQTGQVNPLDLLRFRQIINGSFTPAQGTTADHVDMNRDGSISPHDLLVFKQLVNGVGPATQAWANEILPPRP